MNEKHIQDFAAFGAGNLEAVTASSQIWAAGVNDLTKQFAGSAKSSFEGSVAAFKALTTVKSVREAMDLQSKYSKTAIADAVAVSKSLTDASIKLV
jgi:phasin family protein